MRPRRQQTEGEPEKRQKKINNHFEIAHNLRHLHTVHNCTQWMTSFVNNFIFGRLSLQCAFVVGCYLIRSYGHAVQADHLNAASDQLTSNEHLQRNVPKTKRMVAGYTVQQIHHTLDGVFPNKMLSVAFLKKILNQGTRANNQNKSDFFNETCIRANIDEWNCLLHRVMQPR